MEGIIISLSLSLPISFSAPTSAPVNFALIMAGTHSLTLSWEPPPFENRNGQIRQYQIQIEEIESGDILQRTSNTTQATVSDLHPYYNYNCSVAAETISLGPFSTHISVQLNEYGKSIAFFSIN